MSNTTTTFVDSSDIDSVKFLLPLAYVAAICIPFITNRIFRTTTTTTNPYFTNNKTIYASLKNLTKSNNKYYVGNYYSLQLNITELFEDLIMTVDTYEFLNSNFSTESTNIYLEFNNETMEYMWKKVNQLLELIIKDLRIDNLYILVSEQSIDFRDFIHKSIPVKIINVLDLYGYLNPKIRKICFQKKSLTDANDEKNVIFDCEDEDDDVIECSSCDEDDDADEEAISKLDRTINTFRCLKKNYKNIYSIMSCL